MLRHIIGREFKVLITTKAQIIGTLISVIVILAAGIVGNYFLNKDDSASEAPGTPTKQIVALAPQVKEFQAALDATQTLQTKVIAAQDDYAKWLAEQAEAALLLTGAAEKPEIMHYGSAQKSSALISAVQRALLAHQLQTIASDLTPAQQAKLTAAFTIPVTEVPKESDSPSPSRTEFFTALIAQFCLFFAVMTGVSTLAAGVIEEKSSRVVEILLSSVRPRTLLLGKILGISLFVLVQLIIYVTSIIISLNIAGLWEYVEFNATIFWTLAWILLGFFTYTTVTGGVSAMVSRQEDAGAILMPIIMLMLIPFYLGMYLVPLLPDSIWTKALSLVPGFSSFMMPVRQAYGTVEIWELLLAFGIGVAFIPLLAALAGKIYENSILRMGSRVNFRQALTNN